MTLIKDGDLIFIIHDKRRRWVRKVKKDTQFHCDRGFLDYNDIIGLEYGITYLLKPNNRKVAILPALPNDIVYFMKRESQIIYPEDIGLILTYGNIYPGSKIIEAGTGSGTVSSIMGTICKPNGHVHTFDIREKATQQAQKNIESMGVTPWCTARYGNICEEDYDFQEINFVMLDLATTWLAIPKIEKNLAQDAKICCFSPNIEQVKKNVKTLKENSFYNIISFELLSRTFQVKPNATRPNGRMVGHSGYLTFASRNIAPLLPELYRDIYSPENIGSILLQGGIQSQCDILLITYQESPLQEILEKFVLDKSKIKVITILKVPNDELEQQVKTHIDNWKETHDQKENFDVIIFDNIAVKNSILPLYESLKRGGTLVSIGTYLEQVKRITRQLFDEDFREISTIEFFKRELIIEELGVRSQNIPSNNLGYVTVGRKVIDNHKDIDKKPPTDEYIENLLDVARDFPDNIPDSEEKINYAELEEDEDI